MQHSTNNYMEVLCIYQKFFYLPVVGGVCVCADEPILTFQRNTFFPLKEERKMIDPKKRKDNEKAIDLLYNEVCVCVCVCSCSCDLES